MKQNRSRKLLRGHVRGGIRRDAGCTGFTATAFRHHCKRCVVLASLVFSSVNFADVPITLTNTALRLSFTADGRPQSLARLADGRELLNATDPGNGFEVVGFDFADRIPKGRRLDHLSYDGKNLTAASGNMRCTFRVHVAERHLAFYLTRVEGIPRSNLLWLRFQCNATGPVGLHPLDPMTYFSDEFPNQTDRPHAEGVREVSWRWLWDRQGNDPLGGFALQVPRDDAEHDETLLHIWAEETLPHPAVPGEWTVERARAWLADWQQRYADVRKLTIEGDTPDDLIELVDLAAREGINCIKLHSNTWSGEYWPDARPILAVKKEIFPGGEPDFKKFADYVHGKGMGLDIHTLSMAIGNRDPEYLRGAQGPDARLASWVTGTLSAPASADASTLLFRPAPGQEFPSQMAYVSSGPADPPFFMQLNVLRIGREFVEVREFTDTDCAVWVLKGCRRGCFSSPATVHPEGTEMRGLLRPYGQSFTAGSHTTLPDELARTYAGFCNRNGITHIELDGLEVQADVRYGAFKFARSLYGYLDHPVTSWTSSGAPMPFQIEYWFSSSRGLGGAKSATMPLALEQLSRRATHPYEVHTEIARVAAAGGSIGGLSKPEPMFSLSKKALNTHGLSKRFIEQLMLWRLAAKNMDAGQRREILSHYSHIRSVLEQAGSQHETRVLYGIERRGEDLALTPFSLLERPGIDVAWGIGQEFGPIVPWQFVEVGENVTVSNRFARQEPHVVIHVLPALGEKPGPNSAQAVAPDLMRDGYNAGAGLVPAVETAAGTATLVLQPKAAAIGNRGDHVISDVGGALDISMRNPRRESVVNADDLPRWPVSAENRGARGLGLTVDGDGSGAVLVVQLRGNGMRDYVVPMDFRGVREIVIPDDTVSWTDRRWGWRFEAKTWVYDRPVGEVRMGFGFVPPGVAAHARVSNLRLLSELPGQLINPVLTVGEGKLQVQGTIPSDRYLWFTGGDTIGVYDLNWNELERLPVRKTDFFAPAGRTQYHLSSEPGPPAPYVAVQLLSQGEPIIVGNSK